MPVILSIAHAGRLPAAQSSWTAIRRMMRLAGAIGYRCSW